MIKSYPKPISPIKAASPGSLDFLTGEGIHSKLDKKTVKRLQEIELLEDDKKKTLLDLIDTYIRDAKARKAYAQ